MQIYFLTLIATQLLITKGDIEPLGQHQYKNFLSRHPQFKLQFLRNLEQKWKDARDYDTVKRQFELYQETLIKYGIHKLDQYNMDEKGFAMGVGSSVKVVILVKEAQAFSTKPRNRDQVLVIKAISISRQSLPAFVIF